MRTGLDGDKVYVGVFFWSASAEGKIAYPVSKLRIGLNPSIGHGACRLQVGTGTIPT